MGSTHPFSNPLRIKVMGGPGTGKTFFLRNHVQELLEKGVAPNRILVFTHSDTAAADFTRLLGHPVPAGTLRSYCLAVLSRPEVQSYTNRVPRPMITFSHKACPAVRSGPPPLRTSRTRASSATGGKGPKRSWPGSGPWTPIRPRRKVTRKRS